MGSEIIINAFDKHSNSDISIKSSGTLSKTGNSNDFSSSQRNSISAIAIASHGNTLNIIKPQPPSANSSIHDIHANGLSSIHQSLDSRQNSGIIASLFSTSRSPSRLVTPSSPPRVVKRSNSTMKEKLQFTFSSRKLQAPEKMLGLTQQDLAKIFSHKVAVLSNESSANAETNISPFMEQELSTPLSNLGADLTETTGNNVDGPNIQDALADSRSQSEKQSTEKIFFRNNAKATKRYLIVSKVKHGKYGGIVVALRVATNELVIIKQVNIFSLPPHLRYSFPCTGSANCKCQNCSKHPLQPLTVGPSKGAEILAAAAAAAAAAGTNPSHAHAGAVAPIEEGSSKVSYLRLNSHSPAQFLFAENGPFKEASPVSPDKIQQSIATTPDTHSTLVQSPDSNSSNGANSEAVPSFEGAVPLELVALQTENDADELPSFVEYWVHRQSGTFYFVTYTHGPRQRKWRNPKTWFRSRFFDVNWEEYLA